MPKLICPITETKRKLYSSYSLVRNWIHFVRLDVHSGLKCLNGTLSSSSTIWTSEACKEPAGDSKSLQISLPLLCPRQPETNQCTQKKQNCNSTIKREREREQAEHHQFTWAHQTRCYQRKTLLCCSNILSPNHFPLDVHASSLLIYPAHHFHLQESKNIRLMDTWSGVQLKALKGGLWS